MRLNSQATAGNGAPAVSGRLHALDGLRAVAAILVLGHHLGAAPLADRLAAKGLSTLAFFVSSLGTSGVELFFVLSGVVLGRPYLRAGRPLQLAHYVRRRAIRLFPPYLVAWLLAGFTILAVASHRTWFTDAANLPPFELRAWLLQLGILYVGAHYNAAWWSLVVEVYFYVAVPLLVPLVLRLRTGFAALVVLAGSAAAALLVPMIVPGLARVPHEISGLLLYAPCFASGLLMARFDVPRAVNVCLVVAGVGLLVTTSLVPALENHHVGYGLLYAGVVSMALDTKSRLSRVLGRWDLVWLGERSYSLFLTHWSIIVLVEYLGSIFMDRGGRYLVVTRVATVPLALLVAMLLFHYVERRFVRGLVTDGAFWPRLGAGPRERPESPEPPSVRPAHA